MRGKNIMKFNKNLLAYSIGLLVLGGCTTTHTEKYEDEYLKTQEAFKEKFPDFVEKATPKQDNVGQEHKGYYVDVDNYFIERQEEEVLPIEFNIDTGLSFEEEKPVNEVSAMLFKKTGIKVEFILDAGSFQEAAGAAGAELPADGALSLLSTNGVGADATGLLQPQVFSGQTGNKEDMLKPISFEGTLRELLDYVGVINNLKWKYDELADKVFFFEQSIETFFVYEQALEIDTSNQISTKTDSSGGDGASLGNQQKISFKKKEDAWNDITEELKSMLSSKGKIAFNTRQGSVVVQDNDFVLSKVRDRIEKINDEAKRTVTVDFSIVNVKVNDGNNLGINWSYVNDSLENALLGDFGLSTGLGSVAQSLNGTDIGSVGSLLPTYGGNTYGIKQDNFNVLLGMLSEVGSVNISTRTTFPTLNNHPMSFQITQNEDYVASIDRETNSETGDENVSTEIETVKDGVTLTVTPRILGEEVRLEYTMSLNVNDGLVQAPGVDGVQLPKESNKDFSQSIIAKNGQTTVVMAYQKEDNKTGSSGPFSDSLWFVGGSESYSTNKEIVVITATPYFKLQ
jgi:type IVB pilus formation R64 PilN family outer membrane protein